MLNKNQIAQRLAKELKDGYYVNLGIGIPTLVANYIPIEFYHKHLHPCNDQFGTYENQSRNHLENILLSQAYLVEDGN